MAIILDADVIIRGAQGTFDLQEVGRFASQRTICDCRDHGCRTLAWRGTGKRKRQATRERYLRAVLEPGPIVPYTEQTAYEHARLWVELEVSGKMIGSMT